jgi:hypothetical protein
MYLGSNPEEKLFSPIKTDRNRMNEKLLSMGDIIDKKQKLSSYNNYNCRILYFLLFFLMSPIIKKK